MCFIVIALLCDAWKCCVALEWCWGVVTAGLSKDANNCGSFRQYLINLHTKCIIKFKNRIICLLILQHRVHCEKIGIIRF